MSTPSGPIEVFGNALDLARPEHRAKLAELKAAAVRLRNFGGSIDTIADKLGLEPDVAERVLSDGIKDLVADDAEAIRARQQAVLNDIREAMYPEMQAGDQGAANVLINTLKHEAEIHHGVKAAQRVHVGVDQEAFATRVQDDMRELGIPARIDVELESDPDDGWATT
jgi:rhodanese-related sulfurtransferase